MIPEQNTFWLSEKTESVIYVIDRYYEGTIDLFPNWNLFKFDVNS